MEVIGNSPIGQPKVKSNRAVDQARTAYRYITAHIPQMDGMINFAQHYFPTFAAGEFVMQVLTNHNRLFPF